MKCTCPNQSGFTDVMYSIFTARGYCDKESMLMPSPPLSFPSSLPPSLPPPQLPPLDSTAVDRAPHPAAIASLEQTLACHSKCFSSENC